MLLGDKFFRFLCGLCFCIILIHFISILLQEEYLKAYYAEQLKQQELAEKQI